MRVLEGKTDSVHPAEKVYMKYKKIIADKNAFVGSVIKIDNKDALDIEILDDIEDEPA